MLRSKVKTNMLATDIDDYYRTHAALPAQGKACPRKSGEPSSLNLPWSRGHDREVPAKEAAFPT